MPGSSPWAAMRSAGCMRTTGAQAGRLHRSQPRGPAEGAQADLDFYAALKAYRANPEKSRRLALRARFDRIFRRRTGFVTLDRLLARLHANKSELLMVLDRPETPLNTNGSENDIRCQVIRRKVSAGTRSDLGRDCRDAFLGLTKTCTKLGVAFWDYLGSRLRTPGHRVVRYCRVSSVAAGSLPDTGGCPGFCPYYVFLPFPAHRRSRVLRGVIHGRCGSSLTPATPPPRAASRCKRGRG